MGINIQTDGKPVRIWRSDKLNFPTYYITISERDGDHWIKDYQDVEFVKGVEVENATDIFIHKAFPKLNTWVNETGQHKKKVWKILEFTIAGQVESKGPAEHYEGWEDIP